MLEAFVDESGSHEGAECFVVAGYIATCQDWDAFNVEWKQVLGLYGLETFHTVDFKNRFRSEENAYRHLDLDKAAEKRLLNELTDVIQKRVIIGIAGVLPMQDYNALVKGKYERYIGNPYTFCTNILLMGFKKWADEIGYADTYDKPIAIWFESGAEHRSELDKALAEAGTLPEFKDERWFGSNTFIKKRDARGLEAADLLAYSVYSEQRNQLLGYDPQFVLDGISKTPVKVYGIDRAGLVSLLLKRFEEERV